MKTATQNTKEGNITSDFEKLEAISEGYKLHLYIVQEKPDGPAAFSFTLTHQYFLNTMFLRHKQRVSCTRQATQPTNPSRSQRGSPRGSKLFI